MTDILLHNRSYFISFLDVVNFTTDYKSKVDKFHTVPYNKLE